MSIEPLLAQSERAGLFVDFDGTLAHIVDVPSAARPASGAAEALATLAEHLSIVAVVSGRATEELVQHLGGDLEIWGVHGAERATRGRIEVAPEVRDFIPVFQRARAAAEVSLRHPAFDGCFVEDKRVAIALHYRRATARGAAEALAALADRLASDNGLIRTDAKMAFELRAPVEISKGSVVLRRAREKDLAAVAFLGDDVVDLAAFDALDELGAEGRYALRVAVDSDEAPPELLARADEVVAGVDAAVDWITQLARRVAEA